MVVFLLPLDDLLTFVLVVLVPCLVFTVLVLLAEIVLVRLFTFTLYLVFTTGALLLFGA